MDWKSIYQSKRMTVNEAIALIHNGDKVVTGFACGEPLGIERALVEQYRNFQDVEIISMLTLGDCPWTAPEMAGHFHLNCLFASAGNRNAIANGTCDFTTCHFYEIPDLLENYVCPDVAVVMVSPPDEHGYVSFGTTVDYTKGVCGVAKTVIAQVNSYMPRTFGNSIRHVREFDAFVEINEPLPQVPSAEISQVDLLEAGVINNAKKQIHRGRTVIGAALGTDKLNAYINNNPSVEMHPINYVNNPAVIAKNDNVVSINSCLQVDLLGQVVADTVGLNQFSAVGGQVDFVRGATMSRGGRSIIAMPSTAKRGHLSRIVPIITEGSAITTPRNDVNYVVTEYGVAQLKGKTLKERARALIKICHPKFRPKLALEYRHRFKEDPFPREEIGDYIKEVREEVYKTAVSIIGG